MLRLCQKRYWKGFKKLRESYKHHAEPNIKNRTSIFI